MIPELLEAVPSELAADFWTAAARGELTIQRCQACGHLQHPPRAVCGACGAADLAFGPVSGRGTVYSFTVVERALLPELRPFVPYVIALVDLDEGPRLLALLRADPPELRIDMPVQVAFEAVGEVTLPVFVPA